MSDNLKETKEKLTEDMLDSVSGGDSDSLSKRGETYYVNCPTCGMPVELTNRFLPGDCPYCSKPIPLDPDW